MIRAPVLQLVQVVAGCVVVDEGSAQPEFLHGAVQLGGGLVRILQGDGGQALEPARVFAHDGGEEVVSSAGIGHRDLRPSARVLEALARWPRV
jgi:hypothetical protein